MNNNKLHYYLPHNIIGIGKSRSLLSLKGIVDNEAFVKLTDAGQFKHPIDIANFTPFLYPLSCLTETIIHNGKEEIPLVELAKIEGTYNGEAYELHLSGTFYLMQWVDANKEVHQFIVSASDFRYKINSENSIVANQLLLFEYLYSRRINIWGIEAIDPRTFGIENPYLITIRK